ncbi:MAG: hypothetical protein ACXVLQ_05340 [Bacteriovorax sp.]
MVILDYLLAISLVLLSVVKTADLFFTSDKALTRTQENFKEYTRGLHKNNKGSISLSAAALTAVMASLMMFYLLKMKIEYREAVYRKESYLCFHYLNTETKKYIKEMALFNWSLRAAFAARNTIINGTSGEVIWKALTVSRNARHFYYLTKISNNKFCQIPEGLPYLKNTPFKLQKTLALEVNIDETSIVRQNQWSYLFYKNPSGIRLKESFCLKTDFQMEGAFSTSSKYQTSEVGMAAILALKCFSGSSS